MYLFELLGKYEKMILTYNKIKDRNQAQKHFKNKGYSTKIINKETGYILFVTK